MTPLFENQSISLEELPAFQNQEFISVEKKFKFFLQIRNAGLFVILFIALGVIQMYGKTAFDFLYFIAAYSVLLSFWILSFLLVELGFRRKSYLLRTHDLVYKTGYVFQKMTAVPKNRIQHVEIRQGLLLRMFGLSKIVLYTAGGSGSDLSISGLMPEVAEQLKEHISLSISEYE